MLVELNEGVHQFTSSAPKRVCWIKQCRDELGIGLKQAKDLCDRLYATGHPVCAIDTKVEPQFAYLSRMQIDSRLVRVLIEDTPDAPADIGAKKILSRASIQLIRAEAIHEAIKVLQILEEV